MKFRNAILQLIMFQIFLLPSTYSQISHVIKNKHAIYVICRGTNSKSALIGRNFNNSDTNITHVGIGVGNGSELSIYNVIDNPVVGQSALVVDDLKSFISKPDLFYYSIWQLQASPFQVEQVVKLCRSIAEKKIVFDAKFELKDDDFLYCSEFCALVLLTLDMKPQLVPKTVKLQNKLFASFLKREILTYFPVDFFQSCKGFKKIFEQHVRR
jgi:hypothetical protein